MPRIGLSASEAYNTFYKQACEKLDRPLSLSRLTSNKSSHFVLSWRTHDYSDMGVSHCLINDLIPEVMFWLLFYSNMADQWRHSFFFTDNLHLNVWHRHSAPALPGSIEYFCFFFWAVRILNLTNELEWQVIAANANVIDWMLNDGKYKCLFAVYISIFFLFSCFSRCLQHWDYER